MAIDTDSPGSPGWWMQQLYNDLRAELPRLRRLEAYRRGRPGLVLGSGRIRSAFHRFQQTAHTNFADTVVSATTQRLAVRSIRTAAVADDQGDEAAWRIFLANNLPVAQTDLYDDVGTYGVGYAAVGAAVVPGGEPVVTIESPFQMITRQNPLNVFESVAGLKVFHDAVRQTDYVVLWLPGQKLVAQRTGAKPKTGLLTFSGPAFDLLPFGVQQPDGSVLWQDSPDGLVTADPNDLGVGYSGPVSETYDAGLMPIVRFGNRQGLGDFELHTDLLDRINQTILNAHVIVTLQAFKQRAIQTDPTVGEDGGLPDEDENGQKIDYNQVFEADPGALWRLPVGAKIWESQEVNMQGVLSFAKDDILRLAAVTKTPFPMFSPDSANQSANGAELYREGQTFKVEDRQRILDRGWAQLVANAFRVKGDATRGQAADIMVDWAPAVRYGLTEMAQADSLSSLPRAQKYSRIYGMSPADVKIALAQANQDAFMGAAIAPKPQQQPFVSAGDSASAGD